MPRIFFSTIVAYCLSSLAAVYASDPLPSWSDSKPKSDIVHFVDAVTKENSPSFVPPAERIATFDNDGTLWVEQPMYVQLFYTLAQAKELIKTHPQQSKQEPLKSIAAGNIKAILAGDQKSLAKLIMLTHTGMASDQFTASVENWLASAKNPRFKCQYTQLVYQPMLELLAYLRNNGFKTYIVTGGGIEFVRAFSEKIYGVPPEQVIGSSVKTKFNYTNGKATIMRLPQLDFIDDGPGKPVGIEKFIGRRPIAAFGNSDGDLQMLEWTAARPGASLCLYVHHTDAAREYAYDRHSLVGKLDKGLDEATQKGWTVVDMKNDWKTIFPPTAEQLNHKVHER